MSAFGGRETLENAEGLASRHHSSHQRLSSRRLHPRFIIIIIAIILYLLE